MGTWGGRSDGSRWSHDPHKASDKKSRNRKVPEGIIYVLVDTFLNVPAPPEHRASRGSTMLRLLLLLLLRAWCGMPRLASSCSKDRSSSQKPRVQSTRTQHLQHELKSIFVKK